jgi:hypothetical protein
VETNIVITQNLSDGKTANLIDTTAYLPLTTIDVTIERTDTSVIAVVTAPDTYIVADSVVSQTNSDSDNLGTFNVMADSPYTNVLADMTYSVVVDAVEVDSGTVPAYGNANIVINL